MKVTVLAFATAAEAIGASRLELDLPDGSAVADLREQLQSSYPGLVPQWSRLAIAVDGELGGDGTLREGAEVALLPPVSGGSSAHLTETPLDPTALIAEISTAYRGAVLTFVGTVRDHHGGRHVSHLTYEAYRPMAEAVLSRIERDAERAAPGLRLVHRLGEVPAGEASVVIAAASPHRDEAYAASRTALERLKREVPIWKREHYAGGEAEWREEEPLEASTG